MSKKEIRIRNVPDKLHADFKRVCKEQKRTIPEQAHYIIEKYLEELKAKKWD